MQAGRVGRGQDVGGEFGFGGDAFEPVAFDEPVFIAEFFPLMKVIWFQVLGVAAEALDDLRVRDTVEDHDVELIANGFGQASDFATTAIGIAEKGMCDFRFLVWDF